MLLRIGWQTALVFLFITTTGASYAEVVDRVIAIVNNNVITLSEVNQKGQPLFQQVAEQASPSELPAALQQARRRLIERLIDKKIIQQEAEKKQITVSDKDVDNALKRILDKNRLTMAQFRTQLKTMDMTEKQYREDLKGQILSSKLITYEIRSKIIIPEDKIIDYYDTHYTKRVGQGDYYVLQIGCSVKGPGAAAEEEARKKAERIRSIAVAGQDFKALARKYSDLPSAVDGGDIGVFKKDEMAPYMRDVVTKLKPGEISPICKTPSGYQIFKVLSGQKGQIITKAPYESVKNDIHDILYQQEMKNRFEHWMKKMRDQAYIKIL